MKKFWKKALCLTVAAVCAFSAVGCGGTGEDDVIIDVNKTQLYIGLVPSGYGNSWLKKAIARFETQYAEYEFEPGTGKHGVQCVIDDVSYGNVIAQSLPNARYKIIYTSDVNYNDLITKNLIYDMTDIVKEKFADKDENGADVSNSVYDKFLNEYDIAAYSHNGKVYGLPFAAGDSGISYDRDLFEEKGLFFLAADPDEDDYHAYYEIEDGEKQYLLGGKKNSGEVLSMGRDGIAGTFDDGLPATYEQFYFLMNYIIDLGITPITWSGKYPSYLTGLLYGIWANNEGADKMRMNYTLTGTADDLIEITSDGTINLLAPVEITNENGYLLHKQIGKYQALDFLDNVIEILKRDSKGYDMAFKESVDHLGAQDNFLKSVVRSQTDSANYKRIAMFHDGTYWENEATATFVAMGQGYGKKDRKIGWMPIPHPDTEGAGDCIFMGGGTSMMFMNANIAKTPELIDVAAKFVQFMHTRESLVEFSIETSMTRPMQFTMTDEEVAQMSYFGQSLYYKFKNSELFNSMSDNPVYKRNYSTFSPISSNNWRTVGENLNGTDIPSPALKKAEVDGKVYFRGMQNFFTESWWRTNVLGKV